MREGWKEVELGEIAFYVKDKIEADKLNSDNYISADNMIGNVGGITKSEYVPESGKSSYFIEGDILVSNIRPYFKKMWYATFSGGCSNDVFIIRTKDILVDSKYLFYRLSNQDFFDFMMAGANGTKMPRGNKNAIITFNINLPPLETQRKIASILSGYDDLIENNLKRIKILEEMAQQTYEEWFVRMRFPGHESATINPETGLPEGWEKVKLSELMDIEGGTQPPKSQWKDDLEDGYVRMIQIRDYYTSSHIAYVLDKKVKKCNKYDVMIARYGASVGRICYGLDGAYNVALVKVIPQKDYYIEFLRWYLKSENFQNTLIGMSQRTAQDGFNKDTFNGIQILKPTEDVFKLFQKYGMTILKSIFNLQDQNQRLREARDILLPRLMMGMIEV